VWVFYDVVWVSRRYQAVKALGRYYEYRAWTQLKWERRVVLWATHGLLILTYLMFCYIILIYSLRFSYRENVLWVYNMVAIVLWGACLH
jgi:hypothetical protein